MKNEMESLATCPFWVEVWCFRAQCLEDVCVCPYHGITNYGRVWRSVTSHGITNDSRVGRVHAGKWSSECGLKLKSDTGVCGGQGLQDHLERCPQFTSVLAFEPTGWTHTNKALSLDTLRPKFSHHRITIYGKGCWLAIFLGFGYFVQRLWCPPHPHPHLPLPPPPNLLNFWGPSSKRAFHFQVCWFLLVFCCCCCFRGTVLLCCCLFCYFCDQVTDKISS